MKKIFLTTIVALGTTAISYAVTPEPKTKVEEKEKTEKAEGTEKKGCSSESKSEGKACCSKGKK